MSVFSPARPIPALVNVRANEIKADLNTGPIRVRDFDSGFPSNVRKLRLLRFNYYSLPKDERR